MSRGLPLLAIGHASSITLAVTFSLCVLFDVLLPEHAMYQVWLKLLPGFEWISWESYLLSLAESYGYGWYFTLVWVPIYNYFASQTAQEK